MPKSYHPQAVCVNVVYLVAKDANLLLACLFFFLNLSTLFRVKMIYHEANTIKMCSVWTPRLDCLDESLTVAMNDQI